MASGGVSPMRQASGISGKLNQIGGQHYTTIVEGGNEASEEDEQEEEEEVDQG